MIAIWISRCIILDAGTQVKELIENPLPSFEILTQLYLKRLDIIFLWMPFFTWKIILTQIQLDQIVSKIIINMYI